MFDTLILCSQGKQHALIVYRLSPCIEEDQQLSQLLKPPAPVMRIMVGRNKEMSQVLSRAAGMLSEEESVPGAVIIEGNTGEPRGGPGDVQVPEAHVSNCGH